MYPHIPPDTHIQHTDNDNNDNERRAEIIAHLQDSLARHHNPTPNTIQDQTLEFHITPPDSDNGMPPLPNLNDLLGGTDPPALPPTPQPSRALLSDRLARFADMLRTPIRPRSDPERAKELLRGLRDPGKSMVQRLTRIWTFEDPTESPKCGICLDPLVEVMEAEREEEVEEADEKVAGKDKMEVDKEGQGNEGEVMGCISPRQREEMADVEDVESAVIGENRRRATETNLKVFPCHHIFCSDCLAPWLAMHTTCPTCRFDIDPQSITLRKPVSRRRPGDSRPGPSFLRQPRQRSASPLTRAEPYPPHNPDRRHNPHPGMHEMLPLGLVNPHTGEPSPETMQAFSSMLRRLYTQNPMQNHPLPFGQGAGIQPTGTVQPNEGHTSEPISAQEGPQASGSSAPTVPLNDSGHPRRPPSPGTYRRIGREMIARLGIPTPISANDAPPLSGPAGQSEVNVSRDSDPVVPLPLQTDAPRVGGPPSDLAQRLGIDMAGPRGPGVTFVFFGGPGGPGDGMPEGEPMGTEADGADGPAPAQGNGHDHARHRHHHHHHHGIVMTFDMGQGPPVPGPSNDNPVSTSGEAPVPASEGGDPVNPPDLSQLTASLGNAPTARQAFDALGPPLPALDLPPMPSFMIRFGGNMPFPPFGNDEDVDFVRGKSPWQPPTPREKLYKWIQTRERELDIICDDAHCDHEDVGLSSSLSSDGKTLGHVKAYGTFSQLCQHRYHFPCLRAANRSAGTYHPIHQSARVSLRCPQCRTQGWMDVPEQYRQEI